MICQPAPVNYGVYTGQAGHMAVLRIPSLRCPRLGDANTYYPVTFGLDWKPERQRVLGREDQLLFP